jgi:hypothetical protein
MIEDGAVDEGMEYKFAKERELDIFAHILSLNINIEGNWILSSAVSCVSRANSTVCIRRYPEARDPGFGGRGPPSRQS